MNLIVQDTPHFNCWTRALVEILKRIPGIQAQKSGWPVIKLGRGKALAWFRCEDKLGAIYTWDFSSDIFKILALKPYLILFIQANKLWHKHRRVSPWTMFATRHLDFIKNLASYREIYKKTRKKYLSGFTGRCWRGRRRWFSSITSLGFDIERSTTTNGSMLDYYKRISKWRVGIDLIGKFDKYSDGKNRRQVEFSGIGIPMVVNYKPYYPDPMIAGKHYIYCEKPEDLGKAVEEADDLRRDLIDNSLEYFDKNFSERGMQENFLRIAIGVL